MNTKITFTRVNESARKSSQRPKTPGRTEWEVSWISKGNETAAKSQWNIARTQNYARLKVRALSQRTKTQKRPEVTNFATINRQRKLTPWNYDQNFKIATKTRRYSQDLAVVCCKKRENKLESVWDWLKGFNDPETVRRANIPIRVGAVPWAGHWGH